MKRKPPSTPAESNSTESKATVINKPPVNVSSNNPYSLGDNKTKPNKPKGKKLTKADIGLPTDFK